MFIFIKDTLFIRICINWTIPFRLIYTALIVIIKFYDQKIIILAATWYRTMIYAIRGTCKSSGIFIERRNVECKFIHFILIKPFFFYKILKKSQSRCLVFRKGCI